jgi:hypothetical protein
METYTYEVDTRSNLVVIEMRGTVLFSDVMGCLEEVCSDGSVPKDSHILWDCRRMGIFAPRPEEAGKFARYVARRLEAGKKGRTAFVGTGLDAERFVRAAFRAPTGQVPRVRFFRTLAEAEEWLLQGGRRSDPVVRAS